MKKIIKNTSGSHYDLNFNYRNDNSVYLGILSINGDFKIEGINQKRPSFAF